MSTDVLDRRQFDALRATLGPAEFTSLLRGFGRDIPVQLHQLQVCLAAGDTTAAGRAVHQLRAVAARLGGTRMADIGARLEQACNDADWPAMPAHVAALAEAARETWSQISGLMDTDDS
jgi:HPt (histidine-containing phosphotransfer) domain-containing protein